MLNWAFCRRCICLSPVRGLILYALALVAISGVAVAQQSQFLLSTSPPEQVSLPKENDSSRRLTINVSISDPEDLKVKEGDQVKPGQLLADRGRERRRLEAQTKQLNLAMHRLEQSNITLETGTSLAIKVSGHSMNSVCGTVIINYPKRS